MKGKRKLIAFIVGASVVLILGLCGKMDSNDCALVLGGGWALFNWANTKEYTDGPG